MVEEVEQKRKWLALFSLIGSLSMIFVDQTALPIALPALQKEFALTFSQLQWIVNAYLLPLATFILAAGSMGDIFGHRRVFCIGLVIFTIASFNCSFIRSAEWLIINRSVQGIGGALMIPTTLTLLSQAFPPGELGKAMGIYGAFVALSLTIGPVIGGYLIEFLSWNYIFIINVPIGLLTLPLVLISNRRSEESNQTIDWRGFILISFATTCLILAIMQGQEWGWNSTIILGLILVGLIAFILFVFGEQKALHPLIDFNLFKSSFFLSNTIIVFCYQFISTAVIFWSVYFQNSLSFSPAKTGTILLVSNIPLLLITPLAGILSDKLGAQKLVSVGGLLLTCCFLVFTFYADKMEFWLLIVLLLSFRCGTSLILTPVFSSTLKMIPNEKQGQASGVLATSRQMGSTFCVAVGGALVDYIYQYKFSGFLSTHQTETPLNLNQFQGVLSGSPIAMQTIHRLPSELGSQIMQAAHQSFNFGFAILCLLFALMSFVIFCLSRRLN